MGFTINCVSRMPSCSVLKQVEHLTAIGSQRVSLNSVISLVIYLLKFTLMSYGLVILAD
jgi:hypothetical protein